jgi:hypothetical protein
VLTCYEEELQDPGLSRAIHINCVVGIVSSEMTTLRKVHTKSSSVGLSKFRKKYKKFNGACGLCELFSLSPSSDIDRWSIHDLESEQALFLDSCLTAYPWGCSTHIRGHLKVTGVCSHCLKKASPFTQLTVSNNGVPVLLWTPTPSDT